MLDTARSTDPDTSSGTRRGFNLRRAMLPALIVFLGFFVVLPIAGNLSGKLTEVTENDQAAFLPDSAESTRSLALETQFTGTSDIPALVVWERAGGSHSLRPRGGGRGRVADGRGGGDRRAGLRAHPERGR